MPGSRLVVPVLLVAALAGCIAPSQSLNPGSVPASSEPAPALALLEPFGPVVALRAAIQEALANGQSVEVQAARVWPYLYLQGALATPTPFKLTLQPSALLAEDAWAEVEDTRVDLPRIEVYEGHVEGEPDQLARLVLTDSWVRGAIRVGDGTFLIRMGLNGNLPYGVQIPPPDPQQVRMPTSQDVRFDPEEWTDKLYCYRFVSPHHAPMAELGRAQAEPIVTDIILDGDAAYAGVAGTHALPLLVAMLAEVDGIFDYEVGIRFRVVGVHLHTDPERIGKPGGASPLANLSAYWNEGERAERPRHVVHLVTGHHGNFARANCIGGAGHPELAYTFTPLNWEQSDAVFHTTAFAHELGHMFSAHHHYGNHVETGGEGGTLMIQGYTPGIRPMFSLVSKSVIRGWAEAEVAGKPVGLAPAGVLPAELGHRH